MENINNMETHKTEALKTESLPAITGYNRRTLENMRILHGAMGLSTESNEILDILKKNLFYGKDVDFVNLCEEVGDLLWYVSILLDELEKRQGVSLSDILTANIHKLQLKRYKKSGTFSENEAQFRDIESERELLERYFVIPKKKESTDAN